MPSTPRHDNLEGTHGDALRAAGSIRSTTRLHRDESGDALDTEMKLMTAPRRLDARRHRGNALDGSDDTGGNAPSTPRRP